ncbi:glycosyltransferase [Salinicola halophyticus]|uniref:glycosyltransferase n=1 Tax=Salinicola halophyticus TaxID=1808881 RepID=UPI003F47E05A
MSSFVNPMFEDSTISIDSIPFERIDMAKTIVGIVRFSVLSNLKNFFKKADDISFEEYAEMILEKNRLDHRFNLFENITLPSLDAQEYQNFLIYVVCSSRLPEQYKLRLQNLKERYSFLRPVYYPEHDFRMKQTSDDILSEINTREAFATFRLDDDDALRYDFTRRLSRYVKPRNKKLAVSFCKGYVVDIIDRDNCMAEEVIYPNTGAGIAVIGSENYKKTIFDVSEKHKRMHIRLPTITDGRQPAYAITTHGENDTGDGRTARSESVSLLRMQQMLNQAGFFTTISRI